MDFRANSIRPYIVKSLEQPPKDENKPRRGRPPGKNRDAAIAPKPVKSTSRRPLTADQQEMASRYIPMAKALSKPLRRTWPTECEEFESAAYVALVEAAATFDPNRNVKFSTFARYRIWGALRDLQRSLFAAGRRGDMENLPSVTGLTKEAENNGRVLNAEHEAPPGEELEALEYVESLFKKLPPRHAEAARYIYVQGHSHSSAATLMGCSKSRLCYLHQEALEMMADAVRYENRHEAVYADLEPMVVS